jgi:hypothetical protein
MQTERGVTYRKNVYFIIYLNVNMMPIVDYVSILYIYIYIVYFRIYIFIIPKIYHYFIANYKKYLFILSVS